jgi:hypothetical protein
VNGTSGGGGVGTSPGGGVGSGAAGCGAQAARSKPAITSNPSKLKIRVFIPLSSSRKVMNYTPFARVD